MLLPKPAPFKAFTQAGAPIRRRYIDTVAQPATGTRERVPNLSDPRPHHRYLGFADSGLSGAAPSFARCFGPVANDGGHRFRFRYACGRMAHQQIRQPEDYDLVDVGFLPRTGLDRRIQHGPQAVARSFFLWGDGWFDGRSDEYSRGDAGEDLPTSHHVLIPRAF